jgi:hypothetical protein
MILTESYRTVAVTEEIEEPLPPPRFANRQRVIFEMIISIIARSA